MGSERDAYDSNDGDSEALKASALAAHLLFHSGSFSLPLFQLLLSLRHFSPSSSRFLC